MIGRLNPWLIVSSSSSSTSQAMWHPAGSEWRGRSQGLLHLGIFVCLGNSFSVVVKPEIGISWIPPMFSRDVEAFGSIFLISSNPTSPRLSPHYLWPAGLASTGRHLRPPKPPQHTHFYDGLSALISSSDRTLMPCHSGADLHIIFLFSARQWE